MSNNFDKVAWAYDFLGRLVFGGAIKKSQLSFLDQVEAGDNVLILGGGTGWILSELDNIGTKMNVIYIDASAQMVKRSKKRAPFKNIQVDFICGTEKDIPDHTFDAVITNFFLDVFNKDNLPLVMGAINRHLKRGGLWLFTDFRRNDKYWQKILLKVMHWFFIVGANLESRELKDFSIYFKTLGLTLKRRVLFRGDMIESVLYKKD